MLEYNCRERGLVTGPQRICLPWKNNFHPCFAEERKTVMFDFVEQPVTIRDYEYSMLNRRPAPVVMQGGLQPVAMFQEDIRAAERPQSLLGSVFSFHRRKG